MLAGSYEHSSEMAQPARSGELGGVRTLAVEVGGGRERIVADWNARKMLALGTLHARLEAECDLDGLMQTLVADPVYEFHPIGLRMAGGDRVRCYYAQFFDDFMQKVAGYQLLDEWVNERSVVQEYDITLEVDGARETHRVVGILYAQGELLGGERIYGSERVVRLMAGPLFHDLGPLQGRGR